jgi:signal peptidase I
MCGKSLSRGGFYHLNKYWENCGEWYENHNISFGDFNKFPFKDGFNKGDVMILIGKKAKDIKTGDVVVFEGGLNYPIIHRVISVWREGGRYYFRTKGDNNGMVSSTENKISEDKLVGKAVIRLPLLGWVKIKFSEVINSFVGIIK